MSYGKMEKHALKQRFHLFSVDLQYADNQQVMSLFATAFEPSVVFSRRCGHDGR